MDEHANARFDVDLTPAGVGSKVVVNGEDVSRTVRGIKVHAGMDQVTRVVIEQVATGGVRLSGEGVVYVREPVEPGAATLEFLNDLDPRELEREMLESGEGLDGKTTGELALDVLRRWASGE